MKNSIGKNIKRIRNQKKITQKELSRLTGFSQNGISNHENGNRKIDEMDIMIYAEALGVKPQDLFSKEAEVPKIAFKEIPVLSKISAGVPIYAEQNIIDYTHVTESLMKNGKEYFGLLVSGDSMDKEFRENDVVIVEKDTPVESGQIGVVMINGYEATVKRIRYVDDSILLIPESSNPAHEPQLFNAGDELTIVGKVVGLNRTY